MKILIANRQRHRPINKKRIASTARSILTLLDQPVSELSILLVGNRKMVQLNKDYRGKNKTTDVLSFEASLPVSHNEAENVLGDIVISVPVAEEQSRGSGTGFYDEVCRLLIHGTLHLLGYKHEDSQYHARKMKKKEEEILDAVKKMD